MMGKLALLSSSASSITDAFCFYESELSMLRLSESSELLLLSSTSEILMTFPALACLASGVSGSSLSDSEIYTSPPSSDGYKIEGLPIGLSSNCYSSIAYGILHAENFFKGDSFNPNTDVFARLFYDIFLRTRGDALTGE